MPNDHPLITTFTNAGQGHVFRWFEQLGPAEQQALLDQASQIDLAEIDHLVATLVRDSHGTGLDLDGIEPAPSISLPRHGGDPKAWEEARSTGEQALRDGRVAAFTVAGGQGTRLGFDAPKGTYPASPVRQATLFQIFAEKILAARQRTGTPIPWYIMTSTLNHADTEAFFRQHDYFGLGADSVSFFRQGLMPAVTLDGKIILESKSSIAMTPDGHGGSLRALVRSGATRSMAEQGIDIISYFQVDNPLVVCIDPAFIGFHLLARSEMSSKMLPKAFPKEKVGNFCRQHGKTLVIEYSDMPDSLCEQRDATGQLCFNAGSIAIHILDRAFVDRMGGGSADTGLPFHRADKKIATIDEQGQPLKPAQPNGVKFEMFVFDALPFAQNPIIIETAREDDFSPVKNAEGIDSPQTSRDDQLRQAARWLKAAGEELACDETGLPALSIEISPLFADSQDAFVARWQSLTEKPALRDGLVLA